MRDTRRAAVRCLQAMWICGYRQRRRYPHIHISRCPAHVEINTLAISRRPVAESACTCTLQRVPKVTREHEEDLATRIGAREQRTGAHPNGEVWSPGTHCLGVNRARVWLVLIGDRHKTRKTARSPHWTSARGWLVLIGDRRSHSRRRRATGQHSSTGGRQFERWDELIDLLVLS